LNYTANLITKIAKHKTLKQIAGFSIIGIIVNVISVVLLFLFLYVLGRNVYLAYILVSVICIGISYVLNVKMVFKARLALNDYFRYNFIYLISMLIGLFIIAVVKHLFNFNDFINSLMATPFTMIWNFFFIKHMLKSKDNYLHQKY